MKNLILKTIAWIAAALLFLSGMALDSASWIPCIVCSAATVYLALFAYANKMFYGQKEERR